MTIGEAEGLAELQMWEDAWGAMEDLSPDARWTEGDSGTKFRPGVYVQADVSYDVGNHWAVGSFLRLDSASEFRAQAGPSVFKVDPSGFSAGFQVRYQLP